MSRYCEGQTHQLMNSFEEAGYTPAHLTALGQSPKMLADVKLVLIGLATISRASLKLFCTEIFNPTGFVSSNCSVWKGPADGDGLEGKEDRDFREDDLPVIDCEKIVLETHLQEGEVSVYGEKKMRRARAGENIQLGGRAFLALWSNWKERKDAGEPEESILEKLRRAEKIGNVIYFFGLTLRGPGGYRVVLCLFFDGEEWSWRSYWLGLRWVAGGPSVALASVN